MFPPPIQELPQLSAKWVGPFTLLEKAAHKGRAGHQSYSPWANQAKTLHSVHRSETRLCFCWTGFKYGVCMLSIFFPCQNYSLHIWISISKTWWKGFLKMLSSLHMCNLGLYLTQLRTKHSVTVRRRCWAQQFVRETWAWQPSSVHVLERHPCKNLPTPCLVFNETY